MESSRSDWLYPTDVGRAGRNGKTSRAGLNGKRSPVNVLIVSETRLHREGLATTLGDVSAISVLGTADCVMDAIQSARIDSSDVVVVDVAAGSGVQEIHEFAEARLEPPVVALGILGARDVLECAEAGAAGCIMRSATVMQAVQVICDVKDGERMLLPPMSGAAIAIRTSDVELLSDEDDGRLTAREREILDLIGLDFSNKEIGQRLHIELTTVKNHVHNILTKLHVRRRAQAAAWLRARQ